MPRSKIRHALVAALLLVAMLVQGTWALAGTTGGLSGAVYEGASNTPVADAKITVSSPSQSLVSQTDASGHFVFVSLAPDTYVVSVDKQGYEPYSQPGVSVFSDATATLTLRIQKVLTEIARVTSRSSSSLVKPGTTADVYSVTAAQQDKISALGGGGSLNSAYSAVASVPGAFVPLNQTGYYQTVHIRGGDYDQVGYELDGVPVNRSFDNYPSGSLSSLGNQELQVYTGAAPSDSEGQGLAGYINQVIKTGTYPGFGLATLGIGTPTFYHHIAAEVGGASPNRNFSYYLGVGGYNQDFRYVDNQNAARYQYLGGPLYQLFPPGFSANNACTGAATDINYSACYANGTAGPGAFALAPYQNPGLASLSSRDVIANVHFAIPHKKDGGRDDIQLLYDSGSLQNAFYFSTNDQGGVNFLNGNGGNVQGYPLDPNFAEGTPFFLDGYQYNGPTGVPIPANYQSYTTQYLYPNSPQQRTNFAQIPVDLRDTTHNNQEIVKAQYQKNFGTSAFFRVYGYTYYSDWLHYGPQTTYSNYIGDVAPDYELSSHTRGVSANFSDQINEQNLLSIQGSYTTASSIRDNNTQMVNAFGTRSRGFVLVNSNDPLSGYCYTSAGTLASCDPGAAGRAKFYTYANAAAGTIPVGPLLTTCAANPGALAGPCIVLAAENSLFATYNSVVPKFSSFSITDEFRPSDKLLLNLGVRQDRYEFDGSSTKPNDPARAFFFAAFNNEKCVQASTGRLFDKGANILTPCNQIDPSYTNANLINSSAQVQTYNEFQPRLSGTYTVNADTVLRASIGKYAQPPDAAFEQYNALQENLPAVLGKFVPFGFNTPGHAIRPQTSINADFSYEHRFHNSDWSMKISPFIRKTKDQIQNFFLDQQSGFVSGLNVGRQTSEGVEFQLSKGDFNRNGLAGSLAFTYTHSFINYDRLSNGNSVFSGINNDITAYNALTGAGGGAKCYTNAGTPDPSCAAGSFANPYYNSPVQSLVGTDNAPTYDLLPGPVGASADAYGAPYFATLIVNYKHDKFTITPTVQFQGGSRYGSPESNYGIDPTSGCGTLAGTNSATDPRYATFGGQAGVPGYDATTCGNVIPTPDFYTGKFDALGAFVQPSQLLANLQMSYQVSPKVTLVGTFANVINTCFGGSKTPFTANGNHDVCSYGIVGAGSIPPTGNVFNPGATIQPFVQYPYLANLGSVNVDGSSTKTPFNFFLEAKIKI